MLATLLLSLSLCAKPPLLVVADIDDTLKVSRIISRGHKPDQLHQLLFETDAFSGSSLLLNELSRTGAKIIYVSAAPKQVGELQKTFLRRNQFPDRKNLLLKRSPSQDTYTYKTSVISGIVAEHPGYDIMLLGDNAEKDVSAYSFVSNQFPDRKISVFIHELYVGAPSALIPEDQIPFLTYAEVSAHLEKMGIVGSELTRALENRALADLWSKKRAELTLPKFVELKKVDLLRLHALLPYPLTELFSQLALALQNSRHEIIKN